MEATEFNVASVRRDVRHFVAENWDPQMSLRDWRICLVDSGWAVPSWPERWFGRGLPAAADALVRHEIRECGAISSVPAGLAGPTILEQGPDNVRERFLRPLLIGDEVWCQLFSEPVAGSDLAGLTSTATRDGDEWIVNGQKVWNTSAHHADFGMLLARTDWDAPKHEGITYFVLPMDQPGVEVRPLRQMNHHSSFNEVFLTEARIPGDWIVGGMHRGWTAALATLAHERSFSVLGQTDLGGINPGRALDDLRAEAAESAKVYSWYPQRAGRADLAVTLAASSSSGRDPVVRQELARMVTLQRIGQWTAQRATAARRMGRPPGPEGSIGKLALSHLARQCHRVHTLVAGAHGLLAGDDPSAPAGGVVAEILVSTPAQSIAGGTDEVQRNILAEKALGLPKEPDPNKGIAYRNARQL
ncbi:MAG: acyl-CoA dehydrogenase family protein [Ilumatobacteraceae bacterium]